MNSVSQLIFVMLKCCVSFAVRTGFLNSIWTSVGFAEFVNFSLESFYLLRKIVVPLIPLLLSTLKSVQRLCNLDTFL
jgi:hypothetical protein